MYRIGQEEANMLRELFGNGVTIYRTCKQKSKRHTYYCSEEPYARKALNDYSNGMKIDDMRKKYKGMRKTFRNDEY